MIVEKTTPEALGILRIAVFGMWLIDLLLLNVSFLAGFPDEFFRPIGVLNLIPSELMEVMIQLEGLLVLKGVAIVFCIAAMLGLRPFPLVAGVAALSVLLIDGIVKGHGSYSNHSHMVILYAAMLLPFFPAADGLSILGRRKNAPAEASVYAQPFIVVGLMLCYTYVFVGMRRVLLGGLEVFTNDAMLHWLVLRSLEEVRRGPELGLYVAWTPILLLFSKVGFFVTTVCEVLSPLALLSRNFRLIWLLVIFPFHIVTLLLMNIVFWENMILLLIIFTPVIYLAASPRAKPAGERGSVVYIDGDCVLCHGFVKRLLRWDRDGVLRFALLQGESAERYGIKPNGDPAEWAVVLTDSEGQRFEKSDASLRTIAAIGGPWRLAEILLAIPRPIRDGVYSWVARNRYRWFGKNDACSLPSAADRARVLP